MRFEFCIGTWFAAYSFPTFSRLSNKLEKNEDTSTGFPNSNWNAVPIKIDIMIPPNSRKSIPEVRLDTAIKYILKLATFTANFRSLSGLSETESIGCQSRFCL